MAQYSNTIYLNTVNEVHQVKTNEVQYNSSAILFILYYFHQGWLFTDLYNAL